MEEALYTMTQNYDLPLDHPSLQAAYQFLEANKNDPYLQRHIGLFHRPTSLKVGTAGAYLWGSLQNYYGDVSKSCSSLHNNSLLHNPEDETCQYQIWNYTQNVLRSVGHSFSPKAYIYVDENWQGFEDKDIEILRNNGIEHATILNTKDSKHNILLPMTSINNLPILKNYEGQVIEHIIEEESSNWAFYLFMLLIFCAFIGIILKWRKVF